MATKKTAIAAAVENELYDYDDLREEHAANDDEYYGDKLVRWYQYAARAQTVHGFVKLGYKRILVALPTGAGKTLSSGIIFNDPELRKFLGLSNVVDKKTGTYKRKMRILFIAHKHRLLSQAERTFAHDNGVELIMQSAFSDIPADVLEEGWDLTVLDEAHHEAMSTLQYKLEEMTTNKKAKHGYIPMVGLTATYDRPDGMMIKFDLIVEPISREQAVEEGWLAPTNIYSFVDPTASSDKIQILSAILTDYHHLMGRTMVFVKTKAEVAVITNLLTKLGKKAVAAVGMTQKQLDKVLDQFSNGEWDFIVNCNMINEGVDVKGCDSVVLGRTYGSYVQLNQVIGRAARPDSECNVFELVNPLSANNLDTTVVTGTPEKHMLIYRKAGQWVEAEFDYTAHGAANDVFNSENHMKSVTGAVFGQPD